MSENQRDIPEEDYKRNEIFLELEVLLTKTLNPTLKFSNGSIALDRFAYYGDEGIE